MKNKLKILLKIAGLVTFPVVINTLIFKKAMLGIKKDEKDNYYNWTYGKIKYSVHGSGEPILMIHGIGSGCSMYEWEQSIKYLSRHYTVYCIDLLGFGGSDKPAITYSSYLYVTLINDVIKNLIKKPVYFIGSANSCEYGVLAQSFEPKNFIKMVLINPTGINNKIKYSEFIKKLIYTPIIGTSLYNMIASKFYAGLFLKRHCFTNKKKVTKNMINNYYKQSHSKGVSSKYPIADFLSGGLNTSIIMKINKINIPVNIIWGEDNIINPVTNINKINIKNENIKLYVFEQCKLLPHVENTSEFYTVCRNIFK